MISVISRRSSMWQDDAVACEHASPALVSAVCADRRMARSVGCLSPVLARSRNDRAPPDRANQTSFRASGQGEGMA
ncbi:hypothetical protein, partial [Bradyrhizobium pachyrhizi]